MEIEDYEFWRNIPVVTEDSHREVFNMEVNTRRMKYMLQLGYGIKNYTEEEWLNFKKVEKKLRKYNGI